MTRPRREDRDRSPTPITELDESALESLVVSLGGRPFQARQLAHWVYRHGVSEFGACRNLPKWLREALTARGPVRGSTLAKVEPCQDGTQKLLLALADGETVETVLIPEGTRETLCISTQVGCPVGCVFCASGLDGVRRNLSSAEIIEQVLHARNRLQDGRRLTNLVVMGMGEPLLNLPALLSALQRITDPEGIGLGARKVTVSTSGLPDRIERLAHAESAYNLAISLHAADDDLRRRLVPTARASVAEIVAAARTFARVKHRLVTFEIVLLRGVNDRPRDADALIHRLAGFPCTVNLIAWNSVPRITDLRPPERGSVDAFAARLRARRLNVTVRRPRGADGSAACGQLRIRELSD